MKISEKLQNTEGRFLCALTKATNSKKIATQKNRPLVL